MNTAKKEVSWYCLWTNINLIRSIFMNQFSHFITIGRANQPAPKGTVPVRCDRKTPLGNPFYMRSEDQRNEVCDKYEEYLRQEFKEGRNFLLMEELNRIADLVLSGHRVHLQCWCAPKRCHAQTIRACCASIVQHKIDEQQL